MSNSSPKERHRARRYALQVLYQWSYRPMGATHAIEQFCEQHELQRVDEIYFKALVHGVIENGKNLDKLIAHKLDRELSELDPIELAVLRLAAYELKHSFSVPYRVVLNEAINLAKEFGATDAHKYVNAVLDKLAIELRTIEIIHSSKP